MSMTETHVDLGNVILKSGAFRDEIVTASEVGTLKEGTILARDSGTGKLVPFVKGGTTNDNGIAKAVLTYDVDVEAAGDVAVRVMASGEVRTERLVIAADGNHSNVDDVVIDQLRDYGIVAVDCHQL